MSIRWNRMGNHRVTAAFAVTLGAIACSSESSNRDEKPVRTAAQALATTSCQALDIAATKASGSKPATEGQGGSSYAIDTSGEVWGWGANRGPHFPLGHASTDTDGHALGTQVLSPAKLGVSGATKLAAGRDGACALLSNGTVSCWGRQLGGPDVPTPGSHTYLPTLVSDGVNNLTGVTAIAYGDNHACALKSDATVWCWGDDRLGQLGDGVEVGDGNVGDATITAVPMLSPAGDVMTGVTRVAAAGRTTCVLRTVAGVGEVDCMGDNSVGQLGQGTAGNVPPVAEPVATPITIPAGSNLSFGELYGGGGGVNGTGGGGGTFCATTVPGAGGAQTTYCWGFNAQGEAAITNTNVTPGIFQVSTDVGGRWGEGYLNGCALDGNGAMSCWGGNLKGQLPGTAAGSPILARTAIPGVSNAFKMAIGESHMCALTGNSLLCWGENIDGQIGNGTTGTTAGVTSLALSGPTAPICTGTPGAVGSTCGTVSNTCGTVDCGACSVLNKCDPTSHTCVDDPTACSPACASATETCDHHVCKSICGTESLANPDFGTSVTLTGSSVLVAPDSFDPWGSCRPYLVDILNASAYPNEDIIGYIGPKSAGLADDIRCPKTNIRVTFYKDGQLLQTVSAVGEWDGSVCRWGGFPDGVHTRAPTVTSGVLRVGIEALLNETTKGGAPTTGVMYPQLTIIPR